MKKSNEIKKGLASCSADECNGDHAECPYIVDIMCIRNICSDAFAYIEQLEAKCHQLEREKCALLRIIKSSEISCNVCKWWNNKEWKCGSPVVHKPVYDCHDCEFEWVGLKEGE